MNTSVAMKHTMVSCCWGQQSAVKRVHAALVKREYTGVDRRRADAQVDGGQRGGGGGECVRGADRSVSQQYKESSNCQVEAQYAMQREVAMVSLMLVEGCSAAAWLGMVMGTWMWCGFLTWCCQTSRYLRGKCRSCVGSSEIGGGRTSVGARVPWW